MTDGKLMLEEYALSRKMASMVQHYLQSLVPWPSMIPSAA